MDARQLWHARPLKVLAGMYHAAIMCVARMNPAQKRVLGGMVFFLLVNAAIIVACIMLVSMLLKNL